MKKKFLSVLLIVAVLIGMAGVSGTQTESGEQKADKEQKQQENEQTAETKVEIPPENEEEQKGWIGVILNGDETEAYTLAHIDGIRAAAENVSLPEQDIIWKERVGANDGCKSAVKDLIRQGCEIIIANSAIYEEAIKSEAEKNPEVDFVVINDSKTQSTVTEDGTELTNLYNVHMDTYEASYVAGVTAGMKVAKLKEKKKIPAKSFDEKKNVKLGYVAAEANDDAHADINAYYLGVKAVCKKVVLQVEYIDAWNNSDAEATAAGDLIRSGCVVLASNTDLDAVMQMAENAKESGKCVYAVGRNSDMRQMAGKAALTSVVSVWSVYYTELFDAKLNGRYMEQNWNGGYAQGAVTISTLGKSASSGTGDRVKKTEEKIKNGKKQIAYFSTRALDGILESEKDRSNSVHRRVPVDKYREYPYNYSYLRSAGGIDIWKMKRFPRILLNRLLKRIWQRDIVKR